MVSTMNNKYICWLILTSMAGAPQIKHHQETVRYILNSLFVAIRVTSLNKIGISHINIP